MTERRSEDETRSLVEYFSILGVSEDSGREEIEARYRELSDHLASGSVPANLREWAARQASLVDEAYAVLSDPERRAELERTAVAAPIAVTPVFTAAAEAPVATAAAVAAAPAAPPAAYREVRREEPVSAFKALFIGVPWKLMALGGAIGLVVLGAVLVGRDLVPGLGGDGEDAPAAAQQGELAPIDTERVAELMALVEQDPKNAEATFELGEIFFLGGEWQSGIDWFTKLLQLDPTNVHALTDIGTANFNLGKYDDSKVAWLKAKEIDPNDEQVHYNLGFLYANVEPVDFAAASAEWQAVVQLAPGSDLANTAQVHLDSLVGEEPSPAPTEAPAAP